ncbi:MULTISPECIES: hypothetical protein [unclassified Streptomyces]|uniref:hypothetical protein n=1 Tax=unclassified Streptomyces TaxID=2593676 RepID=UPI0011E69038|nr:hypothetical protein [Streptomyces sp. sk2.1]TXS81141.1 hypothetical protein EAO76_00870 [Streptomyces sp. sk2.1]
MNREPLCALAAAAALAVAVLCGTGPTATAAPAHASQNPAAASSAPSSAVRSARDGLRFDAGWTADRKYLPAGVYFVHCFTNGESHSANGRPNTVWLLIDDDSGNADVWVSRVCLSAADCDAVLSRC